MWAQKPMWISDQIILHNTARLTTCTSGHLRSPIDQTGRPRRCSTMSTKQLDLNAHACHAVTSCFLANVNKTGRTTTDILHWVNRFHKKWYKIMAYVYKINKYVCSYTSYTMGHQPIICCLYYSSALPSTGRFYCFFSRKTIIMCILF